MVHTFIIQFLAVPIDGRPALSVSIFIAVAGRERLLPTLCQILTVQSGDYLPLGTTIRLLPYDIDTET